MKIKNNINKLSIDTITQKQLQNVKELQNIFDKRASFYKKAFIGTYTFKNGNTCTYLKSYNTIVACIFQNQLRIYEYFSQTTARHIKEFAKQNGFNDILTINDLKNTCVISK